MLFTTFSWILDEKISVKSNCILRFMFYCFSSPFCLKLNGYCEKNFFVTHSVYWGMNWQKTSGTGFHILGQKWTHAQPEIITVVVFLRSLVTIFSFRQVSRILLLVLVRLLKVSVERRGGSFARSLEVSPRSSSSSFLKSDKFINLFYNDV